MGVATGELVDVSAPAGAAVIDVLGGLASTGDRTPGTSRNLDTMYLFSRCGLAANSVAMNPSGRHRANCCGVRRVLLKDSSPCDGG